MSGVMAVVKSAADELQVDHQCCVVLFGSFARGGGTRASDIDLLVLLEEGQLDRTSASAVRAVLRRHVPRASVICLTPSGLQREAQERPSFAAHLVAESMRVAGPDIWSRVFDDVARASLDRTLLKRELADRVEDLRVYEGFRSAPEHPISCLADLYGLTKAVVIVRLLLARRPAFDWRTAFALYAALDRHAGDAARYIEGLRPFYTYASGRDLALQRPHPTTREVGAALSAAAAIARSGPAW